jgi:hypothetical protein
MFDFAGNLGVKPSRIESLDAGDAAAAFQQGLPRLCRGIADGGDEADARDYDSAGNKKLSFLSLTAFKAQNPGPAGTGPGPRTQRETKSWCPDGARLSLQMREANAGIPRGRYFFLFSM